MTTSRARVLPNEARRGSGIYTLEDLRLRSVVDSITGCWSFAQKPSPRGCITVRVAELGKVMQLGSAVHFLSTGKRLPEGMKNIAACRNRVCCNPAHRKVGTQADVAKIFAHKHSALTKAKISRIKRAECSPLSDADVLQIRISDETSTVLGERYGVTHTTISKIKRGVTLRYVGAAASVFAWRP